MAITSQVAINYRLLCLSTRNLPLLNLKYILYYDYTRARLADDASFLPHMMTGSVITKHKVYVREDNPQSHPTEAPMSVISRR